MNLKNLRNVFGRALKSKGTLAQMGQARFAKELGNLLPGSKIYVSGAMSGLPGKNVAAFNRAESYLKAKGFQVLNPAHAEKSVPGMYPNWKNMTEDQQWSAFMKHDEVLVREADAVVTMNRGSWGSLKDATLSKGAKQEVAWARQQGKPVIRASRVEPAMGPMETVDIHAKPLTAADREIQYNNLYPEQKFASIDPIDPHRGAVANPFNAPTIGLSRRSTVRSMHAPSEVTADVWSDVRRNPFDQDRVVRNRQNARRTAELHTERSMSHTPTPGRPTSNTVPAGGRIPGMMGKFRSWIETLFKSPWRGIIGIGKDITELYTKKLGKFGGVMVHHDVEATISSLRSQITGTTARDKYLHYQLDLHAKDLLAAQSAGFANPILIPKGRGMKGLRATIVHERTHQLRKLEGSFGEYYGRDAGVGEAGANWITNIGYHPDKVQEEAIAFGAELSYIAGRKAASGHKVLHGLLDPMNRMMNGDIAGDLMDFAAAQGAHHNPKAYIQKRAVMKAVETDTMQSMGQVANAQTRNTVPGMHSSLGQTRGIRRGPKGGQG